MLNIYILYKYYLDILLKSDIKHFLRYFILMIYNIFFKRQLKTFIRFSYKESVESYKESMKLFVNNI